MIGNTGSVKIEIHVDDKGTVKVKKFGDQVDKTGRSGEKSFKRTGQSLDTMNKKLTTAHSNLLKVTAAFAAVVAAGYTLQKVIDVASDLEEVTSKFNVVFEGQIQLAEKWAETLTESYIMSTREARQYLSSVQDLLVPMGMQADMAGALSFEIVKLSADLGSFNNLPTAQVMDDIQSALVGNYETMKKYGAVLNATVVQETALAMGLARTKDELTAAHKAQAAYELMVKSSQAAIGDIARTSGSYANQTKQLRVNIEELTVLMGNQFLRVATDIVTRMNDWIKANDALIKQKVHDTVNKTAESLKIVVGVYNALPEGVVGAAGVGIAGRILFGGTAGKTLAALAFLNTQLKSFGMNIGSLPQKFKELSEHIKNMQDALSGKIDWRTGALLEGLDNIKDSWMGRDLSTAITLPVSVAPKIEPIFMEDLYKQFEQFSQFTGPEAGGWFQDAYGFNQLQEQLAPQFLYAEEMTSAHFQRMKEITNGNQIEIAEIYAQSAAQIEAIEAQKRDMMIWSAQTIADRVAMAGKIMMSASGKQNKVLFAITKTAAIASAVISTYKAVMLARASAPPPMNYALAAAELAFGLAQVAKIKSQGYGDMGGGGVSVGTYPASPVTGIPALPAPEEKEEQKIIVIIRKGDDFSEESIMDLLMDKINVGVEVRGARLVATEVVEE